MTKPGGYILVAYIMNEYSVITYAIKEKHIKEGIEGGMLDESFHCTEKLMICTVLSDWKI